MQRTHRKKYEAQIPDATQKKANRRFLVRNTIARLVTINQGAIEACKWVEQYLAVTNTALPWCTHFNPADFNYYRTATVYENT